PERYRSMKYSDVDITIMETERTRTTNRNMNDLTTWAESRSSFMVLSTILQPSKIQSSLIIKTYMLTL
ncbi:MAG: hypothetical protein QXV22_04140, partial [Thermoplasmataceae archaeon]